VEFLDGYFWGCFENMFVVYFSEMEQNRLSQPDGPKVVKVVLRDSWMGIFWGCFGNMFVVYFR